jgi:ribosomal-protein-alanine N-acetyltransferase
MSSYVFRPLLATRPTIRWSIARDLREMVAIDAATYGSTGWTEAEFLEQLRHRAVIGMVAEQGGRVVGFMLYQIHSRAIEVLNFGVLPEARREGVGRLMVSKLIGKLSEKRTAITTVVRERNDPAIYFFRAQGFRATGVEPGYYQDTGEDGYRMVLDAKRGLGAA